MKSPTQHILLTFTAGIAVVLSFPSGAPDSGASNQCDQMTPAHGATPQTSALPYGVKCKEDNKGQVKGNTLHTQISAVFKVFVFLVNQWQCIFILAIWGVSRRCNLPVYENWLVLKLTILWVAKMGKSVLMVIICVSSNFYLTRI